MMPTIAVTGQGTDKRLMPSYQNAVTDKLILLQYPEFSTLCVSSKHSSIKFYKRFSKGQLDHDIKALLSSSIFASTTVVQCNTAFTLCPNDTSIDDHSHYFQLTTGSTVQPHAAVLDKDYTILFKTDENEWNALLVEPQYLADVDLLHRYKAGLSMTNAVYFSKLQDQLLIRVYSAQNLLLANRFHIDSKDDIFYFIMLAVEQLSIDINKVHFELIGDAEQFDELKKMFANYLPMLLKMPLLQIDASALSEVGRQEFEKDWFASVALQCV